MAIETTRVIVNPNNGESYPYVYFNFAAAAKVDKLKPAVDIEGTVALRLTPYRMDYLMYGKKDLILFL